MTPNFSVAFASSTPTLEHNKPQISRHFGPFRAFLKLLPVSKFYFRSIDLDLLHPVFSQEKFIAVYLRYGSQTGQKMSKRSVPGALEAKPEVEIWRQLDFWNRRPRLPIRPPIHYGVYLARLWSFSELRSKVGQSTQLPPV